MCACVCRSVFVCACAQALGSDVCFCVTAQRVGVNTSVCVSSCTDVRCGGHIISHGLSHNVECIYLFSSVDVLGCVRLHRGAYLRKTVSTPSMCVCHLGEFCSRTIGGEGGVYQRPPKRGSEYGAHFHVVWITVHAYPVSVVGLHVCMTFAL